MHAHTPTTPVFEAVPTVATSSTDGTTRIFTLSVYFDGRLIAGRAPRPNQERVHPLKPRDEDNTLGAAVAEAKADDLARDTEHIDSSFKPSTYGLSIQLSLLSEMQVRQRVCAQWLQLHHAHLLQHPRHAGLRGHPASAAQRGYGWAGGGGGGG